MYGRFLMLKYKKSIGAYIVEYFQYASQSTILISSDTYSYEKLSSF